MDRERLVCDRQPVTCRSKTEAVSFRPSPLGPRLTFFKKTKDL